MASRKRVAIALEDEGCLILGASRRTSDRLNKSWKGSVGPNTCALQQVDCKVKGAQGSCSTGGSTSRKSAHGKSAHGKSVRGKSVRGKNVRGKIGRKTGTKPGRARKAGTGGPSSDAGSDAGGSTTRRSTRPGKRKRERPRTANPADDPGAVAVGVLDVKEGPGAAAGSRGVGPTRRQHAAAASAAAVAVTAAMEPNTMAARYEVHITRTPLGLGIHEEDTLVKVSGAMTGDEVITQGVRCGDILLKVSTSIFTDAPCTRLVGLRVVFDYGRVWGSLPPMSLKHPFSLTCGSWLKSWHNTIPLPHTRLSRCH